MNFKYPKEEKLKSQKKIDALFQKGISVSAYPLRMVFVTFEEELPAFQFGVSVSKRYFKKAVDRNYIKRLLREVYRENQHVLKDFFSNKNVAIMLLYQQKELPNKNLIELKFFDLVKKLQKNNQ